LTEYSVKHENLKKSIEELNNEISSMDGLAKTVRVNNIVK